MRETRDSEEREAIVKQILLTMAPNSSYSDLGRETKGNSVTWLFSGLPNTGYIYTEGKGDTLRTKGIRIMCRGGLRTR